VTNPKSRSTPDLELHARARSPLHVKTKKPKLPSPAPLLRRSRLARGFRIRPTDSRTLLSYYSVEREGKGVSVTMPRRSCEDILAGKSYHLRSFALYK
jgi:hypothetical protein